jgi:hypothetical protein
MKIPFHRSAGKMCRKNLTRSEKKFHSGARNEKTYFYVFVCSNEKLENHS